MQPAPRPSRVFKFGIFEANFEAGELRKSGMRQKLAGQPFQVLQLLLERPGAIVTREELQKSLWPKDTFVDYELALKKAVNRIREVLGDSAESPRFIETIPRRGYRFIGAVEELRNGAHSTALPTTKALDSIVVLPFTNFSPDPENEFFTDGITEEIINALAQIEQLHVVARSSAFSFKGKHMDPRAIGEQLKVRTVLEGSVRRSDSRLRITVQLINAADGFHLWSERYDREMKDVFDIQDEIARSVVERLKITLDRRGQETMVRAGTKDLEAYQLYLKGRILLARRGPAFEYIECFERAVKFDPNYAQAWAGLADSYTVLGYSGFAHPQASMPKGMEAARRAVALDPSLAEAHCALAMASLMGGWDRAEAEREFLRALELNPRYTQARAWYALFYLMISEGRSAEAMAEAKRGLESDPLSSYAHSAYGLVCGCAGDCVQAVQLSQRGVELDPQSYLARYILQTALYLNGRFEEAVAVGESALAMSGRHVWAMVTLALTLADAGKPQDADAVYAEMFARARRQYVPPGSLTLAAAAAAREDEATRHACEAAAIRDPHCQFFFSRHVGPYSARLYACPQLRDVIAGMGRTDWLLD